MGQPAIHNRTPFAFEMLFPLDEEGRPLVVPLVQATYALQGASLAPAEVQLAPSLGGERYGDDPMTSSYRLEPQTAFTKAGTDVVLLGHAYAPRPGAVEGWAGIRLGPVEKMVRVVGDRIWVRTLGAIAASPPRPFERIPLRYEVAFGGWDRSHADPAEHRCEPQNPVGIGFRASDDSFEEGIPLPNIEDPRTPIRSFGQRVSPVGFGFISPDWKTRAALGGTYDEKWRSERAPLLPQDFDRRFFNAASPGLVTPERLRGDEQVDLVHVTPGGRLTFRLPGVPPPTCRVSLTRSRGDLEVPMFLDTVIVDADEALVLLLWRGHAPVARGPHDVRAIRVTGNG